MAALVGDGAGDVVKGVLGPSLAQMQVTRADSHLTFNLHFLTGI